MSEKAEGGLSREQLIERLKESSHRIGQMCKERRGPKMRIPATPDDDDMFICAALDDAAAALQSLSREREAAIDLDALEDDYTAHRKTFRECAAAIRALKPGGK